MTDNRNPRSFETVLLNALIPADAAAQFRDVILPFELMPHQQHAVHCGLSWSRFGLYPHTRTGKTIVMQLLSIFYRKYGLRTIFIMPPVLFDQFIESMNEIENHGLSILSLEGESKKKLDLMQSWALRQIAIPDVLLISKEMFSGPHGKKNKDRMRHADILKKTFKCISWDECHLGAQNETSAIFKAVEGFIKWNQDARLILSTGTPASNELRATYPLIRLKSPEAYQSRRHFDLQHVLFREVYVPSTPTPMNPSGRRKIKVVDGYQNKSLLSQNIYHQACRATRQEVLNLEQPNLQLIPIRLSPAHLKFYNKVMKDRIAEIDSDLIDLRQAQTLRQFALRIITSPEWGGATVADNAVVSAMQAIFDSCSIADNKIVVFANFNNSIEYLSRRFANYKPALVYGPQSSEKNRSEVVRFREDPECRLSILNPQAGGVGIKFGDVSQTVIFAEPVSTPGLFEQASSRILLKGQTEPVAIYILKVLDTISPKAIDLMLNKTSEIQEVMHDKKHMLEELLAIK